MDSRIEAEGATPAPDFMTSHYSGCPPGATRTGPLGSELRGFGVQIPDVVSGRLEVAAMYGQVNLRRLDG